MDRSTGVVSRCGEVVVVSAKCRGKKGRREEGKKGNWRIIASRWCPLIPGSSLVAIYNGPMVP